MRHPSSLHAKDSLQGGCSGEQPVFPTGPEVAEEHQEKTRLGRWRCSTEKTQTHTTPSSFCLFLNPDDSLKERNNPRRLSKINNRFFQIGKIKQPVSLHSFFVFVVEHWL